MKYISICSGIEAATVAWHPLGWSPVAFAEIEKFPSAVLAHHYPTVPNRGDMTKFNEWPNDSIDLLVGGTPCQAFSVAGLRKGLDDPRGNLTLTFLALARRYRPQWVVWENVPGVLSDRTNAFGQFLAGLGQLGYGWSYRVLDAQYFGVAQRRRRVFVVANLGDWRRAAAVLFEPESLRGDSAPSRTAGQRVAPTLDVRAGRSGETSFHTSGGLVPERAGCLDKGTPGRSGGQANYIDHLIPQIAGCLNSVGGHAVPGNSVQDADQGYLIPEAPPVSLCLNAGAMGRRDVETETLLPMRRGGFFDGVTHALKAEGADASEDGTGRGTPLVPVVIASREVAQALTSNYGKQPDNSDTNLGPNLAIRVPIAFPWQIGGTMQMPHSVDVCGTLVKNQTQAMQSGMAVRRLTPRECERLQGFPDDYTLIPYRGKPAADGPRYKALGNSMAVPVMHWIGKRIDLVQRMTKAAA